MEADANGIGRKLVSVKIARAGLLFAAAAMLCAGPAAAQQRREPPNPLDPRPGNPLIREGDSHYAHRQEKRVGWLADKTEIGAAVRAYDTATEAADSVEARWKLARALVFQGNYTQIEPAARQAVFEKGRRVSEDAIGILEKRARRGGGAEFASLSAEAIASQLRKDPDAAPSFYWAAVSWGQWALALGKHEATRLGAAQKIRDYSQVVIALDPEFEGGGGYRVLGRLHDQAPRMQVQTEWVLRAEGIRNLRLAMKTDPANFANRLFLAEALAAGTPAERAEAVQLARGVVADAPSPTRLVEDLQTQQDAAKDLRDWK